ncbi:sel1 repeat family protein [Acidipila sp. EB88]|uniref:SEL1-like repeat protein n=1 Tax=Acidipila sp. EB88 TaxID=2305226 RepID=UPI000F5F55BA|nr:sel1 repeat family protein [Acidipila sp. EB88]
MAAGSNARSRTGSRLWGLLVPVPLAAPLAVPRVVPPSVAFAGQPLQQAGSGPVLTEEPQYQSICKAAVQPSLPPEAAVLAAASRSEPPACDEATDYYGFGKAPDYPAALRCAYRHRAQPTNAFVEGPLTLGMLYANGYGVKQDYALAVRFACEAAGNSASAETELRVSRLEALRDGRLLPTKPFDLCDDATSGAMGSYCEGIAQRLADVGRTQRLQALRAQLPPQAQAMLPGLLAAERDFEHARGKGEYAGGGGTGSAGFQLLDQGQLREQFLINLTRFAAGDLPHATPADRLRAEQQLKAAAASAQARYATPQPYATALDPTPKSLAATQQAWQALYQAWLRFVPVAYPHLPIDRAATELLHLRIHQLTKSEL